MSGLQCCIFGGLVVLYNVHFSVVTLSALVFLWVCPSSKVVLDFHFLLNLFMITSVEEIYAVLILHLKKYQMFN